MVEVRMRSSRERVKRKLRRSPELCAGRDEFDAHARLSAHAPADVDYAALLFGLVAHVGQEKPLAVDHDGFENERAPLLVCVDRLRLFVEWLFLRVRAINEQGNVVDVAQALAAISVALQTIGRRSTLLRAGPLLFRLPQCLPDTAQCNLPSNRGRPACWPTIAFKALHE